MTDDLYTVIRDAIINKRQVLAFYDGFYREMCPHTLGTTNGDRRALFFQFAGESSRGLPPSGMWRCMSLSGLRDVQVRDGDWHTGTSHTRPQKCIAHVELEVEH